MEAKHTPGPWTVGHEMNSERPGSVPVEAPARDSLGGKMHVAFVNGRAGEQDANARLIAAAPDLLAALEAVVKAQDDIDAGTVHDCLQRDAAFDSARAAIARATGGGA